MYRRAHDCVQPNTYFCSPPITQRGFYNSHGHSQLRYANFSSPTQTQSSASAPHSSAAPPPLRHLSEHQSVHYHTQVGERPSCMLQQQWSPDLGFVEREDNFEENDGDSIEDAEQGNMTNAWPSFIPCKLTAMLSLSLIKHHKGHGLVLLSFCWAERPRIRLRMLSF